MILTNVDELLTPGDSCRVLGVSRQTMINWRKTGDGPPWIQVSAGVVRYRRSALESYLTERETFAKAEG